MPDYGFNLNLSPQTKPTSLSDMLNMAGAAQNLQQNMQLQPLQLQEAQQRLEQSRQMNPLQVQQAQQLLRQQQLATQKAEALTPQEITTGGIKLQEEAKQAPIATKEKTAAYKKQQGSLATQIATGLLRDPSVINMAKDPEKSNMFFDLMNKTMINQGVDPEAAQELMTPLIAVAKDHPERFVDVLKFLGTAATTSAAQAESRLPQLTTGPNNSPVLFNREKGTVEPAIVKEAQQKEIVNSETNVGQRPSVHPTEMNMPPMRFKKREAGDASAYAPGEKEEQDYGIKYRQSLTSNLDGLTRSKRNLEEVIETSTGLKNSGWPTAGTFGTAIRTIRNYAGDPTYKQLSKDLAQAQLSLMQSSGGSLDSQEGIRLSKYANGDETYPPDVLINISRRTFAELQDTEMKAIAANRFAERYGDSNPSIFKELWRKNSDSKLFEAISIQKSNLPDEQKAKEIDKLYSGITPQQAAKFRKMRENLEQLMETGTIKSKM